MGLACGAKIEHLHQGDISIEFILKLKTMFSIATYGIWNVTVMSLII